MKTNGLKSTSAAARLPKCPTGIQGLDEITGGGLPQGCPTLVCGGAGCGTTQLAVEFLVRGAVQFGEPGVFMAFGATEAELKACVASLGCDLAGLVRRKQIMLDYVYIERSEVQECGEYDLDGLFARLNHAIDSIGAKRVVLDTPEALFASLPNDAVLRAELRRLFRWLQDKGVTVVITAERGRGALTRHGLEEYIPDCVILLDHRVHDQIAAGRRRGAKNAPTRRDKHFVDFGDAEKYRPHLEEIRRSYQDSESPEVATGKPESLTGSKPQFPMPPRPPFSVHHQNGPPCGMRYRGRIDRPDLKSPNHRIR